MQTLARYFIALLLFLFAQIVQNDPNTSENELAEQCSQEPVEIIYHCSLEKKELEKIV
jgi:hypothetical protein